MLNDRLRIGVPTLLLLSFLSCLADIGNVRAADWQHSTTSAACAKPKALPLAILIAQANDHALPSARPDLPQKQSTLSKPSVETSDLVNALRKTKLINPTYKLGATANGDQILITTERKPNQRTTNAR